jgi:RND family efflux transporter MFP subunit
MIWRTSLDATHARGRRRQLGVAALISTLLLGMVGCSEEAPAPEPIRPLLSLVIADAEGFRGRRFAGKARAVKESNLAFEVPGKLTERPIDVGDEVAQGQVLARLDPRDFQAALKSAQAELVRDTSNLERGKKMLAEDVVSQVEYDRIEARELISEANVELAEKALADSVLLAPFSGRVAAIYIENFENVRAKELVLRLLDTSQLEMVIEIPEKLIGSARFVEDLRVRFDPFPEVEIPATVKEIGSEASETTRTYPVTLVMTPPEGVEILAGMAGEATGSVKGAGDSAKTGFEVPVAAVFADDASQSEQSYVWVVDEAGGTVTRRPVEMGAFGARGVFVKGLEVGDRIAIAGVHSLREGQSVRIED